MVRKYDKWALIDSVRSATKRGQNDTTIIATSAAMSMVPAALGTTDCAQLDALIIAAWIASTDATYCAVITLIISIYLIPVMVLLRSTLATITSGQCGAPQGMGRSP